VMEVVLFGDCFVPVRSSDFILVSVWLRCNMFSKICLVCVTGMLECMFVMSRDAKVEVGLQGYVAVPGLVWWCSLC
jgi:hypothetical protein